MSDITINYKGGAIATMDASGTKTLLTDGKYCEDDIEVVYVKPSGGGGNDFIVSLSKNNQTGYWEPDKTWNEVSAAIADNKTFVICIAGTTHNSELAADGTVYNDGITAYLSYVVYETLQDQSNNYYVNEYWYSFRSTGITQESPYVYYDTSNANATSADILSGKTAFNSSGSVSGSIPSKTSADLTANNLTVTAPSGYYASAASKTLSDQNLVAGNIKKNVSIFGVTGTYEGGGGSNIYYTQYTLTGDTTIATFIPAIQYAVHSTSCIIILRSNGTVAPSTGSYTMNNIMALFQSGVRKSAANHYVTGKKAPDSTTTDVLFTKETNTLIDMSNGVLTTTSTGTSCIGAAGDVVTLVEIDVDDDFYDILRAIQTV